MKTLRYFATGKRALTSNRTVIHCQQVRYCSEPRKHDFAAPEAAISYNYESGESKQGVKKSESTASINRNKY